MKRFNHLFILLISTIAVGLYPLVCPIATAYAISSEFAGLDSSEVLAASSDGSGATVEQRTSVSDESTDVDEGVIPEEESSSVASAEANATSASLYQYLYIAYPQLPAGTDQVIAFATSNDSDVVADATLELESTTGHTYYVEAIGVNANSAAFQFGKDYAECGYDLISIAYHLQGDKAEHSVDLMRCGYSFDIDSSFAVDNEIANNGTADSVYYSDNSGNLIQASSIGDALAASNGDHSIVPSGTAVNGAYVIALDPGHGGLDPGAQGNGKSEADLTWKIAVACKEKLERYGFKVVMSRDQFGSYSGNDFLYRVQRCVNQGAQAFVSFHINSGSSAAHGAEVYAPTDNGSSYTKASVELAQKVMNNLQALGLSYRGVFQMAIGDEFAVIRCAREQGIPGILIEHGFISNSGDVWNYFSDAGCKRLGEADADAIIAQFPLSSWMDYSSVFDADYYLNKYPDVAKWANNDKDKALQHFVRFGMREGRRGNEAFDVQSYYNEYRDLRLAYGTDLPSYYNHYVKWGKGEGRHASGCTSLKDPVTKAGGVDYSAVFDPEYYLENNDDVRSAYTETTYGGVTMLDDSAVLRHFLSFGMREGRRGNEAFDVQSYYNEYRDLRLAYGTDLPSYYNHYVKWGKGEGRHASGCTSLKDPVTKAGGVDYSAVFDPEYYLENNDDVRSAYTETTYGGVTMLDDSAVLRHFLSFGMREGRRGNEAFDVYGYKTRYLDLRRAYGNDLKAYYNHYLRYGIKEGRDGSSMTGYEGLIMSPAFSSYQIAATHYLKTVGDYSYPTNSYKEKGAASISEFCKILYEEASAEGVCPEVLYAQVMKETGYLQFGNLVQPDQCNFGGLGATGPGHPGYTFASVREGLRAQVQHLKAYATTEPLINSCIDPRFSFVPRGCAPKTTDLNGRWAVPGIGYGESLNAIISDLLYLK